MKTKVLILASVAALASAGAALAAVTFDAGTGTGFVGKGDVQLALGLNNAQLQNASLSFTVASTAVTESSWLCTNTRNQNVQERSRTTTESVQGVLSAVARVRNQITGYNLTGYVGQPTVISSETEGPQLNSCPTNWVLTPGTTTTEGSSSSGLYVNGVPLQ